MNSIQGLAQRAKSIEVKGKIIVEGSDISDITIFNTTANTGAISDKNGEFKLQVALDDDIEVSALQYQNIKFKVNEAIIKTKTMKLFLIEEINKLEEVVLSSKDLTGNLNTDVRNNKPFEPQLNSLYFGVKNNSEFEFKDDYKSGVNNLGMNYQQQSMIYGLNIVNVVDQLLLPLFRSGVADKKKEGIPEVPIESIKYYFGSEFLVDNFNIPEHRVGDFIQYVQGSDFDYTLLNYGREMEFLEFLNTKSDVFLDSK